MEQHLQPWWQRYAAVLGVLGACGLALMVGPRATHGEFHRYADQRTWLGVPHAGDVLSNLTFFVAAWLGLSWARRGLVVPRPLYNGTAVAIAAIGLGSGAYHWWPHDVTLACDWGPIVVALMFLLASLSRDRFGPAPGSLTLLVVGALSSVMIWYVGGGTSGGDMRWYVAIQGAGVLLPLLFALLRPGHASMSLIAFAVGWFVLARIAHRHDRALLELTGISGHSLKHVCAAIAAGTGLRAFVARIKSP